MFFHQGTDIRVGRSTPENINGACYLSHLLDLTSML